MSMMRVSRAYCKHLGRGSRVAQTELDNQALVQSSASSLAVHSYESAIIWCTKTFLLLLPPLTLCSLLSAEETFWEEKFCDKHLTACRASTVPRPL
jgi:hypothetical protein